MPTLEPPAPTRTKKRPLHLLVAGRRNATDPTLTVAPGSAVTPGRIPSLDGLRAFSIALVIGYHVLMGQDTAWMLLFDGGLGVRVFFVISGFLITSLLLAEQRKTGRIDLRQFFLRRAFRILPVVVVFLAVVVALAAAGMISAGATEVWASLLFVRNYTPGTWFTGHFWSLSVEEQFYLFWPATILALSLRGTSRVALALLVIAPLHRMLAYKFGFGAFGLFQHVDAMMIGALLAMIVSTVPEHVARAVSWSPLLGRFAAFAGMFVAGIPGKVLVWGWIAVPFTFTVQALCAAYLIASYTTVRLGWSYRLLNWRPVAWVGVLSYSLYVWQQLFLFPTTGDSAIAVETAGLWADLLPEAWLARVGLVFAVAVVSYYGIERPALGLRTRLRKVSFSARASGRSGANGRYGDRTVAGLGDGSRTDSA